MARPTKYNTEEEKKEARALINKKYREKHSTELKLKRKASYEQVKDDPEYKEKAKEYNAKARLKPEYKEKVIQCTKKWLLLNPDKVKVQQETYREKNKEHLLETDKQRRLKLKEEFGGLAQYTILQYGIENLRNNPEIVEILLGIQNIIHLK